MELTYASEKLEAQCTSFKTAKKLFGGDAALAEKLFSRINALKQAPSLKDIASQHQFHFHQLANKGGRDLRGCYAIDVKSRANPWRLILRPLDENKEEFESFRIDEMASNVEIVKIIEVSKHYE